MTAPLALFDSHGGATLDGTWLDGRPGLTFDALRAAWDAAGYLGGLVQGLPGVCGYEHAAFAKAALAQPNTYPVAAWDGSDAESLPRHIAELKALGFVGVHAHPRACGVGPDAPAFHALLRSAGAADLPIFYCAYPYADVAQGLPADPLPALAEAMRQAPGARVVLLHGGAAEVLRYAEFTRANPRVLLDLSFTLMRYGAALDAALSYVLQTLDRRVCIGTDAPEYSPADVRARFEALTAGWAPDKSANIAGGSLTRFLGLDLHRSGA